MLKDASQDPAGLARALGSAEFHQVIGRWEPAGTWKSTKLQMLILLPFSNLTFLAGIPETLAGESMPAKSHHTWSLVV